MSLIDRTRVLVTGGAGFIGSALVRHLVRSEFHVVNLDKLTYAGNLSSLAEVDKSKFYRFVKADVLDCEAISAVIGDFRPDVIMHLAAESHVDRSIDGPAAFVQTNVVGTCNMLSAAFEYWRNLSSSEQQNFRFHYISTDEVFGSLGPEGLFTEDTPYDPRSPYSASKASGDHLVRAWYHTYGFPALITNCSNNYGPYHFPEKLIPLAILNAIERRQIPVYGTGDNVRDWLYVDDHVSALEAVIMRGEIGRTYNIGGGMERSNLNIVESICDFVDALAPHNDGPSSDLITFVQDRPGHDKRYAIDSTRITSELGWRPTETLETGLRKTVEWYLANDWWWRPIRSRKYGGERLGL